MIELILWLPKFQQKLIETFGNRIFFLGLQGSYARSEATESSDIDLVVILDELTADDISRYNTMLETMPQRELICGFLAGKAELMKWEVSDLFQFYYDTKPIYGTLDELLSLIDAEAIDRAIKIGACNIYHGTVHNMLYEKSDEILKGLYKSASFVLQAICFRETGKYISSQKELLQLLSNENKIIAETFMHFKNDGEVDFQNMSETLFNWAKKYIAAEG